MEKVSSSDDENTQQSLQDELGYSVDTAVLVKSHSKHRSMDKDKDKEKKKLKAKSVLTSDEEVASKKHMSFLGRLFGFKAPATPTSRDASPVTSPKDVSFVIADANAPPSPQLPRSLSTPEGKRAPQRKRASAKLFEEVVIQQDMMDEDDSSACPGTPKSPSSPNMSMSPPGTPGTPSRGRGRTVSKRPTQTLDMFIESVVDHTQPVSTEAQNSMQVTLQQRVKGVDPLSMLRVDKQGWVYFQDNGSNLPKMICIFYAISMKALQEALAKRPECRKLISVTDELTCSNVIHLKKSNKDNTTELVRASFEFVEFFISNHV